jgi:hypothetical protein
MTTPFDAYFPKEGQTWIFEERAHNLTVTVSYVPEEPGNGRQELRLDLPVLPDYFNPVFYDRMALTPAGLELKRMRLIRNQEMKIDRPLVVTPDLHAVDTVPILFQADLIGLRYDTPPVNGSVTNKIITADVLQFMITARALRGEVAYHAKVMRFEVGRGLTLYEGDTEGVPFVYVRKS